MVRHLAPMGEMKIHTKFWSENLKGRDHSEDLGVDGRIMMKCMLGKQDEKVWTGFIWLKVGIVGELL
jgi:hypothetical protein